METALPKSKQFELPAAHPLDEFYAQAGKSLPPLTQVEGESVPEPHKSLLVHTKDMTPTLEKFHQRPIHLRVMGRRRRGNEYFREVVLLLDGTNQPVEFGAIKIYLDLLPAAGREQVLAEQRPLGHILAEHKIPHHSRPSAFLRMASDLFINDALNLTGANVLYGRHNTLLNEKDQAFAEIVEILPPVKERGR